MNWREFFRRLTRLYDWRYQLCIWSGALVILGQGMLRMAPPEGWGGGWRALRITYAAATVGPILCVCGWVVAGLAHGLFQPTYPENDQSTDE